MKKRDLGLCGHPGSLVPVRCASTQKEDAQQLHNYMTNAFITYDNNTRGTVLLFRQDYHLCKNNNNQLLALVSICYRVKI